MEAGEPRQALSQGGGQHEKAIWGKNISTKYIFLMTVFDNCVYKLTHFHVLAPGTCSQGLGLTQS